LMALEAIATRPPHRAGIPGNRLAAALHILGRLGGSTDQVGLAGDGCMGVQAGGLHSRLATVEGKHKHHPVLSCVAATPMGNASSLLCGNPRPAVNVLSIYEHRCQQEEKARCKLQEHGPFPLPCSPCTSGSCHAAAAAWPTVDGASGAGFSLPAGEVVAHAQAGMACEVGRAGARQWARVAGERDTALVGSCAGSWANQVGPAAVRCSVHASDPLLCQAGSMPAIKVYPGSMYSTAQSMSKRNPRENASGVPTPCSITQAGPPASAEHGCPDKRGTLKHLDTGAGWQFIPVPHVPFNGHG
jgi:hypothetical protein